jgi:hypothetical protein
MGDMTYETILGDKSETSDTNPIEALNNRNGQFNFRCHRQHAPG